MFITAVLLVTIIFISIITFYVVHSKSKSDTQKKSQQTQTVIGISSSKSDTKKVKSFNDVLDDLVNAGTLSQNQNNIIRSAMSQAAMESTAEHKTTVNGTLDRLVKDKVITKVQESGIQKAQVKILNDKNK
jgi:hypothetical protein